MLQKSQVFYSQDSISEWICSRLHGCWLRLEVSQVYLIACLKKVLGVDLDVIKISTKYLMQAFHMNLAPENGKFSKKSKAAENRLKVRHGLSSCGLYLYRILHPGRCKYFQKLWQVLDSLAWGPFCQCYLAFRVATGQMECEVKPGHLRGDTQRKTPQNNRRISHLDENLGKTQHSEYNRPYGNVGNTPNKIMLVMEFLLLNEIKLI